MFILSDKSVFEQLSLTWQFALTYCMSMSFFLHVGRLDIPQGSVATCLSWGEIFIKRLHYKFTTEFNGEKN